jgi:hypothetical protein
MQLAGPLTYADGTVLQGTPDPTMQAYAAPLGLHAHPAKSAVYSAATATAISAADLLGLRLAPDGFLVAGSPVCFPAFQAERVDVCADHTCLLLDELQALQLAD